jgi:hypothetical protein
MAQHIPHSLRLSDTEPEAQLKGAVERLVKKRETLDSLIRSARTAEGMYRAGFADSLFAIKRFLEEEADDGECLESFDENWMFSSFSIEWRHLAGRKRPIAYLPLYYPKSPDIRILRPNELPKDEPYLRSQPENTLIIAIRPQREAEGPKRARQYAEAVGREEWLK